MRPLDGVCPPLLRPPSPPRDAPPAPGFERGDDTEEGAEDPPPDEPEPPEDPRDRQRPESEPEPESIRERRSVAPLTEPRSLPATTRGEALAPLVAPPELTLEPPPDLW